MKEKLINYVDLLFAGASNVEDIKQEILQNTLDRYDDLITQGKSPQSAYQQAISGIGDINEILSNDDTSFQYTNTNDTPVESVKNPLKWIKALAIAFFILCPIPIILLENTLGVCLCLALVAVGVVLLIVTGKEEQKESGETDNRSPLNTSITNGIWGIGLAVYFLLSFSTGAWHITWLVFPILGCSCGIVDAIFDFKHTRISALVRLVIYALLIIVLTTSAFRIALSIDVFTGNHTSSDINGTVGSSGTVSGKEIQNIEIEWLSGDITICSGNTDNISFQETTSSGESKEMSWKQSGNKLIIHFSQENLNSFVSFGTSVNYSKDLVITVPQNWIGNELTVQSVSASVHVSDLNWNEMNINTVSGEGTISNCNVNEVTLETVSGELKFSGTLNTLECESVSADCEITVNNHPERIKMDGVSCDLVLYLPEDCGFTLDSDSVSGGFSSEFSTTTKNGKHVFGNGNCKINADSMSGDVVIHKIN